MTKATNSRCSPVTPYWVKLSFGPKREQLREAMRDPNAKRFSHRPVVLFYPPKCLRITTIFSAAGGSTAQWCSGVRRDAGRGRCCTGLSHSSGCAPRAARAAGSVWMWHNHWSGLYPGPLWGEKKGQSETDSQSEKSDELVFGSAGKKKRHK